MRNNGKKERGNLLEKIGGERGKEIWRKWGTYVQGQTRARVGEQGIERESSFRVHKECRSF